jgi:alpha-galactosidase
VSEHVRLYKKIRPLVQFGDFYRLLSPYEGNETAWMFIGEDGREAVVFYFNVLAEANSALRRLRLKGLDPEADYEVEPLDGFGDATGVYGGDHLMYAGLSLQTGQGDFQSRLFRLRRVEDMPKT